MDSQKVAHNSDLIILIAEAAAYDFNRQINPHFLPMIDPSGVSVLQILLPFHEASFSTGKEEPRWPDHHRCFVYIKVKDTMTPERVMLDVTVERWNALKSQEEWMEANSSD